MYIAIVVVLALLYFVFRQPKPKIEYIEKTVTDESTLKEIGRLQEQLKLAKADRDNFEKHMLTVQGNYQNELLKNQEIISQKKSSETRLGQITEHLVPFLENFRHDPKNCHFLGQPIDLIAFDFDQGEITFIEVKTGNAQESKRQKMIKNIIKAGKVYYESVRVNPKGVTVKKQENTP